MGYLIGRMRSRPQHTSYYVKRVREYLLQWPCALPSHALPIRMTASAAERNLMFMCTPAVNRLRSAQLAIILYNFEQIGGHRNIAIAITDCITYIFPKKKLHRRQ